jgi:hypothetical protein
VAKPGRRVLPLDLPGRKGEGRKAVAQLDPSIFRISGRLSACLEGWSSGGLIMAGVALFL